MTTALDLVLSAAVASYSKPEVSKASPAVVKFNDQKLVKVERKPRTVILPPPPAGEAPKATAPKPRVVNVETAMAFIEALKASGKRPNANGVMVAQGADVQRADEKSAIDMFVGYKNGSPHGVQLDAARALAARTVRPIDTSGPSRQQRRHASNTVKGFVAGLPDMERKIVLDLLARERLAAEAFIEHVRAARNREQSMHERKLSIGLARLEQERIASIRADLAKYAR